MAPILTRQNTQHWKTVPPVWSDLATKPFVNFLSRKGSRTPRMHDSGQAGWLQERIKNVPDQQGTKLLKVMKSQKF